VSTTGRFSGVHRGTAAEEGLFRVFLKVGLLTGCRSGELLALRWTDLDLDTGTLTVARSLAWVPGAEKGYGKARAIFGPPKSESSRRTLELPSELVHDFKAWFLRSRSKAEDALVFSNTLGGPLHRAWLHKGLRAALAACPTLPRITLHGMRHTFATLLIEQGRPVTEVAALLGHKDAEITLKRYAHWFRGVSSRDTMQGLAASILTRRR
jgi:integrase